MTALYLNLFVGIVQSFLKVPALKAMAPTQTEAPFVVVQIAILISFFSLATLATVRARGDLARSASAAGR